MRTELQSNSLAFAEQRFPLNNTFRRPDSQIVNCPCSRYLCGDRSRDYSPKSAQRLPIAGSHSVSVKPRSRRLTSSSNPIQEPRLNSDLLPRLSSATEGDSLARGKGRLVRRRSPLIARVSFADAKYYDVAGGLVVGVCVGNRARIINPKIFRPSTSKKDHPLLLGYRSLMLNTTTWPVD